MRHLLNKTFTHQRKVLTEDEYGQPVESWVNLGTIPGRLRQTNIQEQYVANQVPALFYEYVFYTMPTVDLRPDDRVVLGDLVVGIVGVNDPDLAGHHLEAKGVRIA